MNSWPGSICRSLSAAFRSENGRFSTVETADPAMQNGGGVALWVRVATGVG